MATLDLSPPASRHSNSAGSPLPRIPRRTLSNSGSRPSCLMIVPDSPPRSATLIIQPPTPPHSAPPTRNGSGSGSSSSSDSPVHFLVPRQRRPRERSSRMRTPEESTPTPAVLRARATAAAPPAPEQVAFPTHCGPSSPETPRAPSVSGANRVRQANGAVATSMPEFPSAVRAEPPARASSVSIPANVSAQLARKKSGEPLKSSLKSRRAVVRGDLSVVTDEPCAAGACASKSEPTTPMQSSKSVHFDAQLEHVKLFLAEQKPLAVSRDGSPTTDTSGTDSDFPAFIFGGEDARREGRRQGRGRLTMTVANMRARDNDDAGAAAAECALEALALGADGAAVTGRVRVRNVAFEKWVAVRFTFDGWQTTSEVTARYVHTRPGGADDVFAFSIRLHDMLPRIDEKTLVLAVRYTVAGREIWDNNAGDNFHVRFARLPADAAPSPPPPPPQPQPQISTSQSQPMLSQTLNLNQSESETEREENERRNMSDLRLKLEKVASQRTPPAHTHTPSSRAADTFNIRSSAPLAARYDLSASFRRPWKSPSPTHTRTRTHPAAAAPRSPPHAHPRTRPQFTARALDFSFRSEGPAAGSDEEDGTTPMPFARVRHARNHQRGGYFDLGPATPGPSARKALPAAFRDAPRFGAVAAGVGMGMGMGGMLGPWPLARGGSEESTPSVTSQSEESSASSSPSGSPREESMLGCLARQRQGGVASPVNDPSYNVFLNKFCFYTGPDSLLDVQPESIQRSHSASSVEEFLSSPDSNYHLVPGSTPARSPSFDDVAYMSGQSTPTARGFVDVQMSPTPISLAS
ncbi:carbohydrate-binding module family 21 protein [Daedalea quercina L-15889]|uniref:Carbohydrate-binding module family 21 protein n=1 Tax=Daedalea quercina L-15889 TaxID=1314783 RepID=A0A165TWK7_9APHY|nr:carbohydrate-binding module family 21 protein [Daedalea quercina L-15889]